MYVLERVKGKKGGGKLYFWGKFGASPIGVGSIKAIEEFEINPEKVNLNISLVSGLKFLTKNEYNRKQLLSVLEKRETANGILLEDCSSTLGETQVYCNAKPVYAELMEQDIYKNQSRARRRTRGQAGILTPVS